MDAAKSIKKFDLFQPVSVAVLDTVDNMVCRFDMSQEYLAIKPSFVNRGTGGLNRRAMSLG
jgi:hypothetical protein